MENYIIEAFQASLTADNLKLKQASDYLNSIRSSSNLIQTCLNIATNHSSLDIRQVSVIYLKNLTKVWKDSKRDFPLPSADKDFLKTNILSFLLFSIPDKIRAQFQEIAFNIAKSDFPWDLIIQQIDLRLSSAPDEIYSALLMICQIGKVYEHKINDRRDNMKILVVKYFKKLGNLFKTLLLETNETKYSFISLILQIYWTCFYTDLPEEQSTVENLQNWLSMCREVLIMDLTGLYSQTFEDHPKWVCKKWAAQILHRFFNRYFNTLYLRDHHKFIGEYFQSNWAVPLSQEILSLLLASKDVYAPNTFINYLLKFLVQAFRLQVTFESLNCHSQTIIVQLVMPLLKRSIEDEDLWKNDPIEYIRKENDMGKAYYSARHSAAEVLKSVCEKGNLAFFMTYLGQNLNTENMLIKDSLIYALGILNKTIKVNKVFLSSIEEILMKFVIHEFSSNIGFLRSRAVWIYSCFSDLNYLDDQHQDLVLSHVCKLMLDPELPVRIEAAIALPKLLDWPNAKFKLSSEIQQVLQIYIELINLIDHEELIEALEDIFSNFSVEVIPFALDLSKCLVSAFLSMCTRENSNESIAAAESTLNTLGKLVDVLDENTETLIQISFEVQAVFDFVFAQKDLNFFDAGLNILSSLLYYCPSGSLPHLFSYSELLYFYIVTNGKINDFIKDNLEDIFSPFGNYLKKYKPQSAEKIQMFLSLATVLVNDGFIQLSIGCRIFMAVLENCSLDQSIISQVLMNSYPVFTSSDSKKIKLLFVQIVLTSLWRATDLTFDYMRKLLCIDSFFKFVIENHSVIREELQILQGIFGICSVVAAFSRIAEVREYVTDLVKVLVVLWNRLQGNLEKNENGDFGKVKFSTDEDDYEDDGKEMYESVFEDLEISKVMRAYLGNSSEALQVAQLSNEERACLSLIMR